ncbi:MAG: transcriptional repressor [Thermoanaerobaculia bacterium]|nr:transcriptional repressor [Thermoanaerobaculia bacterium]
MERTSEFIRGQVDEMIRRCRDAGMNVTPQRIAIYRALVESTAHPSPEMLFNEVSRSMPSLSLATIYKTLETLEGIGLVREIPVTGDRKRFDAIVENHHHLICNACGSVGDYHDDALDQLPPRRRLGGFIPQSVSVNISGLCPSCRDGNSH